MGTVVWALVGLACLVVEALTVQIVMAYFGVGALAAAAASALGAPPAGELAVFAVVSLTLLVFTRRVIVDLLQDRQLSPPAPHALVGRGAVVTIPISSAEGTGQIRVGGEFWTARLESGGEAVPLPVGAPVEVADVTGVTAWVRPRVTPGLERPPRALDAGDGTLGDVSSRTDTRP